jgi:hypothetical protein
MAFDGGLAQRIRTILADMDGVTERRMFGGLAFMLHGNMFAGVLGSTLMARVGPDAYAAALRSRHAREMDFTGRPMKGYVFVAPDGLVDDAALAEWVWAGAAFAASLPRKAGR